MARTTKIIFILVAVFITTLSAPRLGSVKASPARAAGANADKTELTDNEFTAVPADRVSLNVGPGSGTVDSDTDKQVYGSLDEAITATRYNSGPAGAASGPAGDASGPAGDALGPAFVQRQKLTGSDGAAFDNFGESIAFSGDTAVVGACRNSNSRGTAYVFVRSGNTWTQQAKLVAGDGAAGDSFGFSVAINSDTVVIGAAADSVGGNGGQGSAYVFVRSGTIWTAQAKLTADDGAASDAFGNSAAISGDTVVVGSFSDNIGANSDQGSAYVFVRSGGVWTQQAKLTANDGGTNEHLGSSTAISASTIIVGAHRDAIGSNNDQGSAYIFVRNGTAWSQQAKLVASDGLPNALFGSSVDITNTLSGLIAVIGAAHDNVGGNANQGSVYVFTRGQLNTWSQTQKLIAADGNGNDDFGHSVSIAPLTGSTIIIGSWFNTIGSNSAQGSAYIFKHANSVWTQQQKLTASDGVAGDTFGSSVAISGETVIVGAFQREVGSNSDQGSAYTFDLSSGKSPFDFDGDGRTDLGIFRPVNGQWWINRSSDGNTFAATFGSGTDRITPGDLTGDGKTDITLFRPSTGQWFVLRSEDSSFYAFPFGTNGDVPAPADYDADGQTDAAVFRPSNSTWFISNSGGGTTIQTFGQAGDVPVADDYDGDGKADIAIYRPSLGQWWIQRSTLGGVAYQFGASTDKTVQGDYTGDGKTDVAFWRPSTGEWFILRSEDNSYYSFPFGASSDLPTPGDYDGDGKADAGVFRPSSSTWFINKSGGGTLIQQFGQTADLPLPNAFVR